jgi:hypothetical protein
MMLGYGFLSSLSLSMIAFKCFFDKLPLSNSILPPFSERRFQVRVARDRHTFIAKNILPRVALTEVMGVVEDM